MFDSWTIADMEARTAIPAERLRYVLDQKILPGTRDAPPRWSSGRGTARRFTGFEAFGIACAALLIGAGLRRQMVSKCMDLLVEPVVSGSRDFEHVPLAMAFGQRSSAWLEIGDGSRIRLRGSEDYRKRPLQWGWFEIGTGQAQPAYDPLVSLGINTAKLRRCFERP